MQQGKGLFTALSGRMGDCCLAVLQWRGKAPGGRLLRPVPGVGRCAPDPLRCSVPGTVAELASFASLTALRQSSTSQFTKRAARASPGPALLGAYTGPNRRPPVTLRSSEDFLQANHPSLSAGAGWPCGGLSEPAEQRSAAGSGRLRPKSDVFEAPYPGPSCRTCPA